MKFRRNSKELAMLDMAALIIGMMLAIIILNILTK